jgi:hypothetical protein
MSDPEISTSSSSQPPWRSAGTRRSWGGKNEIRWLLPQLGSAAQPDFERRVPILLRLALAPPDRLLGEEALLAENGGYRVHAGEPALCVFVQPIVFEERSEDLGEAQAQRCREAIERFARGPLQVEAYLLVHNRDPRSPAFRHGLDREIAALRASGRVAHALAWDARDLVETALDGLFDLTLTQARGGHLSVAPVEAALASSADLLTEVPLQISHFTADQHRLGADEDPGTATVADPAALLLAKGPAVRTFLLGSFGFGKTTAVARSLLQRDVQVLYVPGSVITQEVSAAKVLLARCINSDRLFPDCGPDERESTSGCCARSPSTCSRTPASPVRWCSTASTNPLSSVAEPDCSTSSTTWRRFASP